MAIFAITFRIHNDASYTDRYESVVKAIKALSTNQYWAESTSFFLIESSSNSNDVASSINADSTFAESKDILVVINLTKKGYKALGQIKDSDLSKLLEKR